MHTVHAYTSMFGVGKKGACVQKSILSSLTTERTKLLVYDTLNTQNVRSIIQRGAEVVMVRCIIDGQHDPSRLRRLRRTKAQLALAFFFHRRFRSDARRWPCVVSLQAVERSGPASGHTKGGRGGSGSFGAGGSRISPRQNNAHTLLNAISALTCSDRLYGPRPRLLCAGSTTHATPPWYFEAAQQHWHVSSWYPSRPVR